MPRRIHHQPGFSLIELLIVIAVIALLLALLIPGLANARRVARTSVCMSNLKQFSAAGATYAVDFKDSIYTFSWTPTYMPTQFRDLVVPGVSFASHAHAIQATEIVRLRSQHEPNFALASLWAPAIEYSHFMLLDYLAMELPAPIAACPEDKPLRLWQSDIRGFNVGALGPMQPEFTDIESGLMRAKPYSSSYESPPATYDISQVPNRMQQSWRHYLYGLSGLTKFGVRRFHEVTFPAQKVHLHDTHQRHEGKPLFFAHPSAAQPLLHFDGSVIRRRTADANAGSHPNNPSAGPVMISYRPYRHEPPTSSGAEFEEFAGRYRWTRGGLKGVDFGGGEVRTR